jgi:hypothetical protein
MPHPAICELVHPARPNHRRRCERKPAMLDVIDRHLALPPAEMLLFRPGRRGDALRSLDELSDPRIREWLQSAMRDHGSQTWGNVEKRIPELGDLYV